ncbi:hypothetical protein FP371_24580 [Citrobacter freundii]|uniref:hypothetical protein n=1 Tax=Gammaproteobacteria TaxID=1236 RepID=UPI0005CFAEDB|nr:MULTISPECIES: hypothetical protein [Gammaproteobacteria]EEA2350442.1 hypothetical protein [Salmonella enterica subsp. enterica serovar Enteritidis]EEC4304220.1 hypothetical protein [Salmonella enterica subsp. enterica serovar Enteritidis]EEN2406644.1 hypothetical protein [Salmonella enterica subsp. enterica serovar Enteritidis]EES8921260.1 hypothetical protein [Escherichia coli]EES9862668.1 hypothetical protein [Escherichia coli]
MKDNFLQELLNDSIIGDISDFNVEMNYPDLESPEITDAIYKWNCQKTKHLSDAFKIHGGVELVAGNFLFVVAPNPKPSLNKIRVTHYYAERGAVCEVEYNNEREAIIDCILMYPEVRYEPGKLDNWMDDRAFNQSFII